MEIIGILKVKGTKVQVSEKFSKLDFVLTDNQTQYPQHISIQLNNDKCSLIDKFNIGDEIKVQVNLNGREWTSPQGEIKYFNTITAWRIEGGSTSSAPQQQQQTETVIPASTIVEDDLPF